jgi:hypothetical protein
MGGGVSLPDVPVRRRLAPSGGDDTEAIQRAIDEVSALPLVEGFRGAILLAPGTFSASRPLTIAASGVVLRGSGSGSGGGGGPRTTLQLTGEPHVGIVVRRPGGGDDDDEGVVGSTLLAERYLSGGSASFTVADASGFAVGDAVLVRKPVTEAWVQLMEMDDLVRDGNAQTWLPVGSTIDTERRVAAVEGNRITLDVPLPDSYDAAYLDPPGVVIARFRPPERVSRSGIEYLHIAAPPMAISHTEPHFSALRMNGEDLWARDLRIEETMNSVGLGGRRITLERVHVRREALSQGSSRPATFAPNGTQILLDRCSVEADNVWFIATGARVSGPIVILNADFRGGSRAESHQRWSTGMLYDNVHAPEGGIELRNRGSMGSGHGWSMGWGVAWNSVAESFIIQHPPGAPNWLIGSRGEIDSAPRPFGEGPDLPNGIVDSHGQPVAPRSLYLAQLRERLGAEALRNIGYDGPL